MSIKDLIWIRVAQALRHKNESEIRNQEYLVLADIRAIAYDTNFFVRANILKMSGNKANMIDIYDLPSGIQAIKNMTDEEFQQWKIQRFLKGKNVPKSRDLL